MTQATQVERPVLTDHAMLALADSASIVMALGYAPTDPEVLADLEDAITQIAAWAEANGFAAEDTQTIGELAALAGF